MERGEIGKVSLSYLLKKESLQLIFFGGKGGVGKTTCASAAGVYAADHGKKTLVFSVDPAPSLSDSFGLKIGEEITEINGIGNLHALEINVEKEYEAFKEKSREEIEEVIAETFGGGFDMPFEREVMRDIMEYSPPGLDELMALTKLNDIVKTREYDLIVVDTAAGTHTIRLLETPDLLHGWVSKALVLLDKYRYVMNLPKSRRLIEDFENDIEWLMEALTNPGRTEFVTVTIPEAMGIQVTEMMLKGLQACKVHAESIVVNYAIPPHLKCGYCTSRRKGQTKRIREIHEKFHIYKIIEVPLFPQQVSGLESLMNFAKVMFEEGYKPKFQTTRAAGVTEGPISSVSKTPRINISSEDLQFILFGGKGGCGKTTSSAATAIHMARLGRRTLVISTDPQHSLPDSFDQRLGDGVTPIQGVDNLYALEIDAEKLFKEWMEKHRGDILEIACGATVFDKDDVAGFFDESLGPGMDEFMALLKIANLMKQGEYDLFILDTAPTGHTLRLLQLPDLMSKWVRLIAKMRSKTQYIVTRFFGRKLRDKADVFLEDLINDVGRVKAILTNQRRTEFIAATTLDEMAIKETERLVASLKSLGIRAEQIIVNGLVPPNLDCEWCASETGMQQKELQDVRRRFSDLKIVEMPLFPHEIRGIDDLTMFGTTLLERQEGRPKR